MPESITMIPPLVTTVSDGDTAVQSQISRPVSGASPEAHKTSGFCVPFTIGFRKCRTNAKQNVAKFQETVDRTQLKFEEELRKRKESLEVTEEQLKSFLVACRRYGADIVEGLNAIKEGAISASFNGIILLTNMNKDVEQLILLLQTTAKAAPNIAKQLEPFIFTAQGFSTFMESTVANLKAFQNMVNDASVISPSSGTENVTKVQEDVRDVVSELMTAIDAAIKLGVLLESPARIFQTALQDALAIVEPELEAAHIQPVLMVAVAPKPEQRSKPVITSAPA